MWNTVFPYILSGISVGGQYALIALGYTRGEAMSALAGIQEKDLSVEEYIKKALKSLF